MANLIEDKSKKIIGLQFDSFAQYVEASEHQQTSEARGSIDCRESWIGATVEDGSRMMREGFEPKKFAEGAARITFAANSAGRVQKHNEVQGMLSIGRYLNGSEKPLLGRVWQRQARPVVNLVFDAATSGSTSREELQRFGEAVYSLIGLLETNGAIVTATMLLTGEVCTPTDRLGRKTDKRGHAFFAAAPVKRAGFPAQPYVISAAVHPYTFRGLWLYGLIDQKHKDASASQGGTGYVLCDNGRSISYEQRTAIINALGLGTPYSLTYTGLHSDNAAAEWVLQQLEKIRTATAPAQ